MSEEQNLLAALEAFGVGRPVVLIDRAAGRVGCGAIIASAERCDADMVNFMATHARGLVCLGLTEQRSLELGLELQDPRATPQYTVSIEAATGVTTGISAADRARTVEVAIDPQAGPEDVVSPGHLFPVVAHSGGVLVRRQYAEVAVDFARLSRCERPAGVFCQALSEDGEEASEEALLALAEQLELPVFSVGALVRYRTRVETLVRKVETGTVDTAWGEFDVTIWENVLDNNHHLLLSKGDPDTAEGDPAPLVRMHSQCLTGDAFHSQRCDCGQQLDVALRSISEAGHGALLYLRQEGRGIGLVAKLQAYALQDRGLDTVEANLELGFEPDGRDYAVGAQILLAARYRRLQLLTNNPRKIQGLKALGIDVQRRVPIECVPVPANERYLKAKKQKLGHMLEGF